MTLTSKFKCKNGYHLQMGNQLFIYCACRYYSKILGCNYYYPTDWEGADIVECDLGSCDNEEDFFVLTGYFQSNKYIDRSWFKIKSLDINNHYGNYNLNDWCIINFRGRDHLSSSHVLSKLYYEESKKKMTLLYPHLKFLVITDDLNNAQHYVSADRYESHTKEEDFKLMSISKYMIVSNSTFSWWASYLNNNLAFCIGPSGWRSPNDQLLSSPHFNLII